MKERPSCFPAIVGGGEGDRHILLVSGSDVRSLVFDGGDKPL